MCQFYHLQEEDDYFHDDVDKFHAEREKVSYMHANYYAKIQYIIVILFYKLPVS